MERARWALALFLFGALGSACNAGHSGPTRVRDGSVGLDPDAFVMGCEAGIDSDGDGIADAREGTGDLDSDGTPNASDSDSDGDGVSDHDEAGTGGNPCAPADSDFDGRPDFIDTDSDNDGVPDAQELANGTDRTNADTDRDGVDDLTESVAGSSPTDPMSVPPAGTLYVVIPYHPPGEAGEHPLRQFDFSTRLRSVDIMFLVDTTGSMSSTIFEVQTTLQTTIIPGVVTALGPDADARYGMSAHGDFMEGGGNYTGALSVFQTMTTDVAAVQAATSYLCADSGGDYPESMVPAMHALITGHGEANYGNTAGGGFSCSLPGTSTRYPVSDDMQPIRDCGAGPDETVFGWACFREGRVPILVLFSDAEWHNNAIEGNYYFSTPGAGTYAGLRDAMMMRGGYFVGIDVGGGDTYRNSQQLAMETGTIDGSGAPIAFMGSASTVASSVIDAIQRIAGTTRQDVTTRTDPDPTEGRLPAGRTTADFIVSVRPHHAVPDAPTGFDSMDTTTFYNVAPSTIVTFEVDFYNDFQEGRETAQVFRATIVTLGRARSEVDRRDVFMVVPAIGGELPI